jgi:hypothetical protein
MAKAQNRSTGYISLLKNGLFEGNVNLKTINLAENTIDFIDTNVFHKHLTKLELVNISHNQLTYFEPWPYVPETPQDDEIYLIFDFRYNLIERFTNTNHFSTERSYFGRHVDVLTMT